MVQCLSVDDMAGNICLALPRRYLYLRVSITSSVPSSVTSPVPGSRAGKLPISLFAHCISVYP